MTKNGNPLTPTRELTEKIIDDFVGDFQKANSNSKVDPKRQ